MKRLGAILKLDWTAAASVIAVIALIPPAASFYLELLQQKNSQERIDIVGVQAELAGTSKCCLEFRGRFDIVNTGNVPVSISEVQVKKAEHFKATIGVYVINSRLYDLNPAVSVFSPRPPQIFRLHPAKRHSIDFTVSFGLTETSQIEIFKNAEALELYFQPTDFSQELALDSKRTLKALKEIVGTDGLGLAPSTTCNQPIGRAQNELPAICVKARVQTANGSDFWGSRIVGLATWTTTGVGKLPTDKGWNILETAL